MNIEVETQDTAKLVLCLPHLWVHKLDQICERRALSRLALIRQYLLFGMDNDSLGLGDVPKPQIAAFQIKSEKSKGDNM